MSPQRNGHHKMSEPANEPPRNPERAPEPPSPYDLHCPHQNVGELERLLSVAGGSALVASGLLRGSFGGMLAALAGGGLIYRGATGHCMLYDQLGISTSNTPCSRDIGRMQSAVQREARASLDPEDDVDYASFDSFPASDPPSH